MFVPRRGKNGRRASVLLERVPNNWMEQMEGLGNDLLDVKKRVSRVPLKELVGIPFCKEV